MEASTTNQTPFCQKVCPSVSHPNIRKLRKVALAQLLPVRAVAARMQLIYCAQYDLCTLLCLNGLIEHVHSSAGVCVCVRVCVFVWPLWCDAMFACRLMCPPVRSRRAEKWPFGLIWMSDRYMIRARPVGWLWSFPDCSAYAHHANGMQTFSFCRSRKVGTRAHNTKCMVEGGMIGAVSYMAFWMERSDSNVNLTGGSFHGRCFR